MKRKNNNKKQIFELQQLILLNHNVGVFEAFFLYLEEKQNEK